MGNPVRDMLKTYLVTGRGSTLPVFRGLNMYFTASRGEAGI